MKKSVFLTLISFLLICDAFGQGHGVPLVPLKIYGGVKLGLNFSNINEKTWDEGYKANLFGGAFAGIRKGRISGQIEALFVQSSYQTGTDFYDIPGQYVGGFKDSLKEGSFKVNTLAIPVLFGIRAGGPLWIQAGPQFSGIVSVSDKDELVNDAKGLFKSGSVSGIIGASVMLSHLNAGARYVFGLSDVRDFSSAASSWKERSIQIHVGFAF